MENRAITMEAQRLVTGFEHATNPGDANRFQSELQHDMRTMNAENYGLLLNAIVSANKADIGKNAKLPELQIVDESGKSHVSGIKVVQPTAQVIGRRQDQQDTKTAAQAQSQQHAEAQSFLAKQHAEQMALTNRQALEKEQFCARESKEYSAVTNLLSPQNRNRVGLAGDTARGLREAHCPQIPKLPNGGWNVQ